MMEHHLIDEIEHRQPATRPRFLTILCILTWIGSAAHVVFSIGSITVLLEGVSNIGPRKGLIILLWVAAVSGCGSFVSAAGAYYVWRRKQFGYYTYLAGQVVPLVVSALAVVQPGLELHKAPPEMLAALPLWFIIPLLFVVLYTMQLRFFRKKTSANH